ncbi:MAG: hypothetical protein KatS3mg110_0605 [Pirellulaceae bacterium]|nr:MAG: hypothetical protein KatS3mg110_0605 [Pirellulaceae bacterium]
MSANDAKTARVLLEEALQQVIDYRKTLREPVQHLLLRLSETSRSLSNAIEWIGRASDTAQLLHSELERFQYQCDTLVKFAATVHKRLNRPRVTVVAVGRLRQGKSRFLQELTGLNEEVIPVSNRGACTGTTLVVATGETGQDEAEVTYYTQSELLEYVIQPCCADLELSPPTSLQQVERLAVPDKCPSDRLDRVRQHLKDVINAVKRLPHLFGTTERIPITKLATYAAIDKSNGRHHLIREIRLTMPIPFLQKPLLEIVDLPGMGDLRPDYAVRMLKTVLEQADLVTVIRMPKHTGDDWDELDSNVTDTLAKAFPISDGQLLPAPIVFTINLLQDGANSHLSEHFFNKARGRFASMYSVNCANRAQVHQFVADLLRALPREGLDRILTGQLFRDIDQFATALKAWVIKNGKRARSELGGARLDELCKELQEGIGECLDALTRTWHPEFTGATLRDEIVACIERVYAGLAGHHEAPTNKSCVTDTSPSPCLEDLLPSPESIRKAFHRLVGWPSTVQWAMHATRAELGKAFRSYFEKEFGSLFRKIREQLIHELLKIAYFQRLIGKQDNDSLSVLATRFREAGAITLADAIEHLDSRESTLGRELYYVARQQMTLIDPRNEKAVSTISKHVEAEESTFATRGTGADLRMQQAHLARDALLSQALQTLRMLRWRLLHACEQGDLQWLVFSVLDELWDKLRFERSSERELRLVAGYYYEDLTGESTRDVVAAIEAVGQHADALLQAVGMYDVQRA